MEGSETKDQNLDNHLEVLENEESDDESLPKLEEVEEVKENEDNDNEISRMGTEMPMDFWQPSKSTIDVCNDGKVLKEIIVEGSSDEIPHQGAEVAVHYRGFVSNGMCFGTSQGRTPYKFVVGDLESADVIKGWHSAVPTMKKGEIALFIFHPDVGYGSIGYGPVPGNTTLFFEIELLEWAPEDISVEKKGEIRRFRIREGPNRHVVPNTGALITIALEGYLYGRIFDQREVTFCLDEGEEYNICPGIEQALYKFGLKDRSRLMIAHSQAFGTSGCDIFGIPPNTAVTYDVELLSVQRSKEVWEMDGQEKLQLSRTFKEKATTYFHQKKYRMAAKFYKRITDYLTAEAFLFGDDEEERRNLMSVGHLSQSLCYLKLNENLNALHAAEEALKFDPNSEKGLFRKGLANLALNSPKDARADFEKLLSLIPTNKAAQQQLQISLRMIKENQEQDRVIYTRMFDAIVEPSKQKSGGVHLPNGTQTRAAPV